MRPPLLGHRLTSPVGLGLVATVTKAILRASLSRLERAETQMPLYEFRCSTCGFTFDKRLRHDVVDKVAMVCPEPECYGAMDRRFSSPHVAAIKGIPNRIGLPLEQRAERARKTWGDKTHNVPPSKGPAQPRG